MARTFLKTACGAALALLLALPGYSQPDKNMDLTQFFPSLTVK